MTAPARVENVRLAFDGDSLIVVGSSAVPLITATVDGRAIATSRIRLSSSDTSVLALSATGDSVIAKRLGRATLTVVLESSLLPDRAPSVTRTVYVVPKSIAIVPSTVALYAIGDTMSASLAAFDANDQPILVTTAQWRVLDGSVARATGSRVTALANGTTQLLAILDGDTARAPLTVAQRIARYRFERPRITLDAIGAETTLVAIGVDALGNDIANANAPLWQSTDSSRVAVTPAGIARALGNTPASVGVVVRAFRPDGGSDSLIVDVNQRATRVVITPLAGTTISSQGGVIKLEGRGYDRLGRFVTDDVPFWVSDSSEIAYVPNVQALVADVTGLAAGTARIIAQLDGAADTVVVTVINDPVSITSAPDTATLRSTNDSLPISYTVKNGNGGTIVNPDVRLVSTDAAVVRVLNNRLVVAGDSGLARVIALVARADSTWIADTTIVHVTNAPVTVRVLTREDTLTFIGDTLTVPIDIRNDNDAPLPRTRVTWTSRDANVATLSAIGLVTSTGTGATWIVASGGTASDSMRLTVTNLVASVTIDGVANGVQDTIPEPGRAIQYSATVRNSAGGILTGYPVAWTSTSPSVATVSSTGFVQATGYGTTSIIVRAAAVADTVRVVVRHPSVIFVNNGSSATPRLGTATRPFATIADGIALARDGDTVTVIPGAAYAEAVSIAKKLTLAGDSSAFLAAGRDPLRLPRILHAAGPFAIRVTNGLTTVRHLTVLHEVAGPALHASDADVDIASVYVNPGRTDMARGSGILIERAPAVARLDSVHVDGVRDYGIRVVDVASGVRVARSRVTAVFAGTGAGTAFPFENGAGIAVRSGRGASISGNLVRTTDGSQIAISSTTDASVVFNSLAGERQLMSASGVAGLTEISDNVFDLARLPGDSYTGNSTTDGRAGLTISSSSGVQADRNRFRDPSGASSLMDAIRLADASSTRLEANRFTGGRRALRTERSTATVLRSRADSVEIALEALGGDTITLVDDTLANASASCIVARSATTRLTRVVLTQCGVGDRAAVEITRGTFDADVVDIRGTNPRAIRADSARAATLRRGTVRGPLVSTLGVGGKGGVELKADSVTVTGSFVTGYPDRTAIHVSGQFVRVDSTIVNRSRTGIEVTGAPQTLLLRDDDLFDGDTAALIVAAPTATSAPGIWWGDGRGPRGSVLVTSGDTTMGAINTSGYRTTPLRAGIAPQLLRKLRGDNQTAPGGTTLPIPFSVRLVDTDGLPVRNVAVNFTVNGTNRGDFGNGVRSVNVITNASGIAEATLQLKSGSSFNTATVTAPGAPTVMFTATGF